MNLRQAFLAISLSVSSISIQASFQPKFVSESDRLITQAQHQLRSIEGMLLSLNITINKEKRYKGKTKENVQNFISQLMVLTSMIQQEKFRNANQSSYQLLIQFNHQLVSTINKYRKNKFHNVKNFKIDNFLKDLQRNKVSTKSQTQKKFNEVNSILKAIEKEGLGLTSLNRLARWFDDNIIAPCQRYSLFSRGTKGLALPFFTLYFYNKFNNWGAMGPHTNILPFIYDRTDKLDGVWSDMIRHRAPIGEIGGAFLLQALLQEFFNHIKPHFEKKFKVKLNEAKGGSYIKEAHRIDEKIEKVRFKDIYGHDEIKRYFKFLVDYLEDSETHDRQGIRPSRGILCIGDTRTGKTFCINAFLEEVNQMLIGTNQIGKFRLIKPSVLKIKYDGMEKILQDAKAKAPCILFIDEIDLLDLTRTGENRTLSEFLTAMGDAVNSNDSRRQIFIIAATNCPETLDKALRQPGRFGKELRFEYPNYKDRFNFISSKVKEFILPEQEKLFNFEKLAFYTNSQSYEAMHLFIKDAMMKAKIDNNGQLTQRHLEEALEEDIFHIIPAHSKNIPLNEQRILSAHFAGQALALALLDTNLKLGKVTIKQVMTKLEDKAMGSHLFEGKATGNHLYEKDKEQRFEYGRIFTYHELDSIDMQTRKEKLNLIKLCVAGFVAEELILGSCGYSCHAEQDKAYALNLAKSLSFEGIDEATLPKHLIKEGYDKAFKLVKDSSTEMLHLLQKNESSLYKIMDQLLEHQTLDYDTINEIINRSALAEQAVNA